MYKKSFQKLLVIACIAMLFFTCKKDKDDDTNIPYVPVNTIVQLNLPQFTSLNVVSGSAIITGGYKGIIVYQRGPSEFVSFDLACPYDPTLDGTTLQLDSSGILVVDYHCGSRFSLYDGTITHGPATRPMRGYHCEYSSSNNSVYITN